MHILSSGCVSVQFEVCQTELCSSKRSCNKKPAARSPRLMTTQSRGLTNLVLVCDDFDPEVDRGTPRPRHTGRPIRLAQCRPYPLEQGGIALLVIVFPWRWRHKPRTVGYVHLC